MSKILHILYGTRPNKLGLYTLEGCNMDGAIAGVFQMVTNRKCKENRENTESKLIAEIETVRQSLETVAAHFESQSDPDLIEACIYETKSLSARYRYLLREAKEVGITRKTSSSLKHFTRL